MARHFDFDETKFKPMQREAALALVEYEFSPKSHRKTKDEIATELGLTRQAIHKWDTQDQNFIAYKNYLSAQFMDSNVAFVYSKLITAIDRGSVRGMELYMKRLGDLDEKQEVTIKQEGGESFEERRAELLKRLGEEAKKEEQKEAE